ncbi:hypothetical protein GCM10009123_11120 [Kangiella japonica]|uniref:Sec-independent protein translocase protein TatA n=1 Tax=Kangiella japonica TaxID=647384 RepID=A0ABN0SY29_9GAMM
MKPGMWELLILLVIILLLFGTKKIRNAGGDFGAAFKNFKKAFKDEDEKTASKEESNEGIKDDRADKAEDAQFSESKDSESNKKS